MGRNCKEYQEDFAFGDPNGLMGACRRSEASMKAMVAAGEAMRCPKCQVKYAVNISKDDFRTIY